MEITLREPITIAKADLQKAADCKGKVLKSNGKVFLGFVGVHVGTSQTYCGEYRFGEPDGQDRETITSLPKAVTEGGK